MLTSIVENLNNSVILADFIVALVILLASLGALVFYFKKVPAVFLIVGSFLSTIVFFIFGLYTSALVTGIILIVVAVLFAFANISDLRQFLIKTQHKKKRLSAKYNREEFYKIIDDTVHSLSRSKTGAIMTFERSINLDDVMKNGTIIDAPVTQELLETIFYEGTRLHDGAVVIRYNIIVAASVYYTPTTRALSGKYGSRHRAAFGISEISDSITVVVSEETGRVSIAYNGSLESIPLDSFLREFSDLMSIGNR